MPEIQVQINTNPTDNNFIVFNIYTSIYITVWSNEENETESRCWAFKEKNIPSIKRSVVPVLFSDF